jgi:hypothetical protein
MLTSPEARQRTLDSIEVVVAVRRDEAACEEYHVPFTDDEEHFWETLAAKIRSLDPGLRS